MCSSTCLPLEPGIQVPTLWRLILAVVDDGDLFPPCLTHTHPHYFSMFLSGRGSSCENGSLAEVKVVCERKRIMKRTIASCGFSYSTPYSHANLVYPWIVLLGYFLSCCNSEIYLFLSCTTNFNSWLQLGCQKWALQLKCHLLAPVVWDPVHYRPN